MVTRQAIYAYIGYIRQYMHSIGLQINKWVLLAKEKYVPQVTAELKVDAIDLYRAFS